MRRLVHSALRVAVSAFPALAQRGPVIVIPRRPDVPIFENGVDISWSVVEGEFGLDRPGLVAPTVIYRPPPVVVPYFGAAANEPGYYPRSDRQPGYGRLEIVPGPNRPLPPPAQSHRRSWSSTSAPTAADLPSPYPPTVIDPIISPVIGPSFNGPPRNHRPWASGRPGILAALLAANRPAVSHPAAARRAEANLSTVHHRICRREAIRPDQVRSDDRSWSYLGRGVCRPVHVAS